MFNIEKSINYALKKAALKGLKINQDTLAAEAGISKQTLYNIFSRDDAKLSQLYSFSKTLGVSIYDTFETPEEKSQEALGGNTGGENHVGTNEKELLATQVVQLQENNAVLKKYVASLERELERYQKDSGGSDTGSSKQIG